MVELYYVGLVLVGLIIIGAAALPQLLEGRQLTFPIAYVAFGMVLFSLPLGLPAPDPIKYSVLTERLTELLVIVALGGAGLKLDRPPTLQSWSSTWRLLAVAMPLTIAAAALSGWWVLGLTPAAAILLGASLAPTDPVLAADVQVGGPGAAFSEDVPDTQQESEIQFALTSETGLNDGLAFPFVYAAIAVATAGVAPENWAIEWFLVDVLYKIGVGTLAGLVLGRAIAWALFRSPVETTLAEVMRGSMALGGTLFVYGMTEVVGGYGFIAVFVSAMAFRDYEPFHGLHGALVEFTESVERLVLAVLLVLLGGAVTTGLLAALTWQAAAIGLGLVFLVRPLAGIIGLFGFDHPWYERAVIAFFGIRGVGSLYYLTYALNQTDIADPDVLWALIGFVVLVSIVVHGVSAPPVLDAVGRLREVD